MPDVPNKFNRNHTPPPPERWEIYRWEDTWTAVAPGCTCFYNPIPIPIKCTHTHKFTTWRDAYNHAHKEANK